MRRRGAVLHTSLVVAWFVSSSCSSDLNTSLDRKECTRTGECLPGYECSIDQICVRIGSQQSEQPTMTEPDAGAPDAAMQTPGVPVGIPQAPACEGSLCEGVCVDVMHDVDNCGTCGKQCPAPQNGSPVCEDGACAVRCADQFTLCGDACYRLASDPQHCGDCAFSCGVPANGRASCTESRCSQICDAGFALCGSACTRLAVDPANCGECAKACAGDEQCAGGTCVKACPPGTQECARSCVNVLVDTQHCGVCDRACSAPASSSALCQQGVCAWQCNPGLAQCNGACIDTQNDPANCGACGQTCPTAPARGTAVCQAGACTVLCSDNYTNCDNQCVSPQLIAAARQAGFGSMPPCAALAAYQSYLMCQGNGDNVMYCGGRCVNVLNDREHCGACNRACDEGEVCMRQNCVTRNF